MRTVIYARFSSDNQNPRSVDDQIAVCRERADREGWPIVATFEDSAISGAAGMGDDQRPGLSALLKLVEAGGVDQVLAESTDRISRHVGDAHNIRERIEYAGARLFTLFDGTVTPIVALVKGFTDAQFRTDLAARVKRGQRGVIAQGRTSGAVAYGYRIANRLDDRGQLIAGLREIDVDRAEIIKRIYREYAGGSSAFSIAKRLNQEKVPPPRSGVWRANTILGRQATSLGILRNPVYIGQVVYGRTKTVVNPMTRRKSMRPNADEARTVGRADHLRIIDDALWQTVQAKLADVNPRPERNRRPKHVLSGLGVCGCCGGGWVMVMKDHWACSRFRQGADCANNRYISSRQYLTRVLADLKEGMLAPDVVSAYLREYHRDYARKTSELGRDRARIERKIGEAQRTMDRLLQAFAQGGSEFVEIKAMLATARDDKERLERELASLEAMPDVLKLHPTLERDYRLEIETLETAINEPELAPEAVPRLRAMIARIIVTPNPAGRGTAIEVVRQMDEILALATGSGQLRHLR